MSRRLPVALASVLAVVACKKSTWEATKIDPSLIRIETDKMVVRTEEVGYQGKVDPATQTVPMRPDAPGLVDNPHLAEATFVLVDALNQADVDVDLTLGGSLSDPAGKAVGTLSAQSIRVPAQGRRTFALVDDEQAVRAQATSADIEILGATVARQVPGVVITEGHVFPDGARVVVTGYAVNQFDRQVAAIVVASFYDKEGVLMERPSTLVRLDGDSKRGMQFVGPDGSTSAYLFVGQAVY